ncbi:unnamed protein product [Rhizoctonia solani]|uniref:Uncharacterized protein n=1 Tax=Rhizoctonia solani TaxID=456999 RepID=A0A8H3D1A8_9AGAM|nr:unnamed protein product [Rhizoctonia solani]
MQDRVTQNLQITFDAHVLAQIYLAELRVLAGRHSYIHDGSLEGAPQARALLNVVVMPLIRHLRTEEYNNLLESIDEAYFLLSRPLDILDELMVMWRIRNARVTIDWRSYPVGGLENYEFKAELPVKCFLEDLLTPLPYPTRPSPFSIAAENASEQSELNLVECRTHSIDSKMWPQSECAQEPELEEQAKLNSNIFAIPFLGHSRGSLDSRLQHSQNSGSSGESWVYEHKESKPELQEMVNYEDMNHTMCAPNHKSSQGVGLKLPRHKRLSRFVKTLFRRA